MRRALQQTLSLAVRASVGSSALQSPGVVQREDIEQNSKEWNPLARTMTPS